MLFSAAAGAGGCGAKPSGHHYLIAKRTDMIPQPVLRRSMTLVRKFEKENWCLAEKEALDKRGFRAECRYEELSYEPMFRGEPAGRWYVQQKIGRFPSSIIIYDFSPPVADETILEQLKVSAPHALKFAALHRAPAQVRIFSPAGEVLFSENED